jgi:hypothetical protein
MPSQSHVQSLFLLFCFVQSLLTQLSHHVAYAFGKWLGTPRRDVAVHFYPSIGFLVLLPTPTLRDCALSANSGLTVGHAKWQLLPGTRMAGADALKRHRSEFISALKVSRITMKLLRHQLLVVYSLTKTSRPNQLSGNNFSLSFLLDCFAIFKYMVTVDYECLSTLCIVVYLLDLWLPHFPSILHLVINFTCCSRCCKTRDL